VPDYIKRLSAQNRAKRKVKDEVNLFDKDEAVMTTDDEVVPDVEITDAEYRKNPLASDVQYWGQWVLKRARKEIGHLYAPDSDGSVPVGYLWARAINCPNPTCRASIPLLRQLWVCNKPSRKVSLRMIPVQAEKCCRFDLVEGAQIDFDPSSGTVQRGNADCPFRNQVAPVEYLRNEAQQGRMSEQLIAVVLRTSDTILSF
jgi:adenine-specific DNA methylase